MPEPFEIKGDFQTQLAEWQKRAQEIGGLLPQFQQDIAGLEQRFIELQPPVETKQQVGLSVFLPTPTLPPFTLTTEEKRVVELAEIRTQIATLNTEFTRNLFYSDLYSIVPALVLSGAVSSTDEALAMIAIPNTISEDELTQARQSIANLIASRDIETAPYQEMPELVAEGEPELPSLVPPTARAISPTSIHTLTTKELLKSITMPRVPETTMTREEWTDYLALKGWSEEEIDNETQITTEQLVAEAQNRKNLVEAFLAEGPRLPERTMLDIFKSSIINPPLVVLEALNVYYEHVSMPAAGWLYSKVFSDIEKAYNDFKKQNPTATEREVWTYAWKQWDTPGPPVISFILKYMLMEGLVDPLTFVGWGIATKFFRVLGPVGRTLAVGNQAAAEVLELPFDFLKWTARKAPRTISQRAYAMTRESVSILDRYFELAVVPGKVQPLTWIKPRDMYRAADDALSHLVKNPRAEDDIARAAQEILVHPPVTRKEATNWIQRLRGMGVQTVEPDNLLDSTLLDIDTLFERVFTKELSVDEAAPLLMQKFGVLYISEVTEDASVLAARLLADRANAIYARALDFTLESSANKVMRAYSRKAQRVFEATARSEVLNATVKGGRVNALLFNLEKTQLASWATWIDRFVVRSAAESYLTFGLYGPMNVLEDTFRSILGGVKPGRMTVERNDILTMGLLDDPSLRIAGISEKYGPLRDFGEAQRTNYILMMSLLPLSAPTYLASAGKITPAKFARGTFDVLVERFGAMGMEMRRNFRGGKYLQLLADSGGDAFKLLDNAIPKDLPSDLLAAPSWVRRNLKQDLHMAATTGKLTTDNIDLVKTLKDRYTKERILRAEVDDILKKYPDISPTARSLVMSGFGEKTLLESPEMIDDFMRNTVLNAEVDDFLKGPERATAQYEELTNLLTSLEVQNPADMADLVVALHRMTATYGALPDQIMARATVKSRGLPHVDRQLQFDTEFDRLYTFMDRAGANIDQVVEFVRTRPHMEGAYGEAAQRYLDIATTARRVISEAKAQDMAYRSSYFAEGIPKGRPEREAFWNSFYTSENAFWRDTSKKMARINSQLVNAITDINVASGLRMPSRPPVVVRGRPLAPTDVAQLMGTRGDDLSRMLLDNLIPEGDKDYFVEYVLGLVKEGQDIGFDRASVEAVYNQIADSILVDPASSSWFRSRQKQLESMTADFHDLYNAKLFPDNQKKAVDGFIDEAARTIDREMYGTVDIPNYARAAFEDLHGDAYAWVWENLGDKLGSDYTGYIIGGRRREFYPLASAMASSDEFVRTLRTALRDIGMPESFTVYRGARKGAELAGDFINTSISRETATSIRADISPSTPASQWEVRAFTVNIDDAVGIGLAKEGELFFKPSSLREVPLTEKALKPQFVDYDSLRQSALNESNKWYYKEYTDYTNANAFDDMMKKIYPFWTYESQRWFWLPRSFMRRPGTLTAWGRWENNTDFGYFHIPGTAIDANPARGTVYGPWSTRLMRRDYPEYYDQLEGMGGFIGFFDFISRYGYYPNIIYGALIAQFGGAQPQTGGILPAIFSTPLNALIAAFPDNPLVNFISERIFPEQFRRYLTARRVDDFGGDGSLIFAKVKGGVALTSEEEALWTQARQSVATHSAAFEQFGMFRMRSDESYAISEAATAFIEENWGFTAEQQRQARLRGEKLWDIIGGLDPWETAAMQELEFFKYSGSINPVLPSQQQEILNRIEVDWADVMAYSEQINLEILDLQQDFLVGSERGRLTPDGFLSRVRELYGKRRDFIDKKTDANPLMLLENRTEYYEKYGQTMPVQSPYNELMDLFFSIELEETVDEFGARVYDWDKFWANREMITDAIPEQDKARWETFLSRHTAPMMKVWNEVYETYLRKYYQIWDQTLKSYSDEEQRLIEEYLFLQKTGQQLGRQEVIKGTMSEKTGLALISSFQSDVSADRIALRYANPHLDAWLFFWGRTSSFQTPQAEEVYKQLAVRTGRVIE